MINCKRCGTTLKSKTPKNMIKTIAELRKIGIQSNGKVYWCQKCYPDK